MDDSTTIAEIVTQIREALFGKDVRESIALGINIINGIATRAEAAVADKFDASDVATVAETITYLGIQ